MTTIDGDRLPGSIPNVPGETLTVLEAESVRTGRTRGELVALAVDAYFAPPVEDPAPAGAVDGGQGATRPPAPTDAPKVLTPFVLPNCTTDDDCEKWAIWALLAHSPGWDGEACCDDHIPDGWVKPSATIATPLPHVHITGEPCVYGDRCGR